MPSKHYISANEFLEDVWRLAAKVRSSGWKPDTLVALWRGGAPVGISVHEFFKATGWSVNHIPLKCASYTGIGENGGEVVFTLGDEIFGMFKPGEKVLFVDDVFDTGKTAETVSERMSGTGAEMKFAAVYWKPEKNTTDLTPDFHARDTGGEWIVFPHEIYGLEPDEIAVKSPALAQIMSETAGSFFNELD